jgi:hypothetical protein
MRMKYVGLVLLIIAFGLSAVILPSYSFWWEPADINKDFKVDMGDVDICLGAWQSNSSSPSWDERCDIAESYGLVNIYDFVAMASHYGDVNPVIPEFPSWTILLVFLSTLPMLLWKRKKANKSY